MNVSSFGALIIFQAGEHIAQLLEKEYLPHSTKARFYYDNQIENRFKQDAKDPKKNTTKNVFPYIFTNIEPAKVAFVIRDISREGNHLNLLSPGGDEVIFPRIKIDLFLDLAIPPRIKEALKNIELDLEYDLFKRKLSINKEQLDEIIRSVEIVIRGAFLNTLD